MVNLRALPTAELQTMALAGAQILDSNRVLQKTGANVVSEVLQADGTFYEYDHYSEGDMYSITRPIRNISITPTALKSTSTFTPFYEQKGCRMSVGRYSNPMPFHGRARRHD